MPLLEDGSVAKVGQVFTSYGPSGPDGMAVRDRPVTPPEFLATVCEALGIDHQKQNVSNVGRPIRIVTAGTRAVREALP